MKSVRITLIISLYFACCIMSCVDDDDGGGFTPRENPLECFDGFELNAAGDACLCPANKIQIGAEECFDTIPAKFVYSELTDCPAGMAIYLGTEETNLVPIPRYGRDFDRFDFEWIIPVASVSGFSIDRDNAYLKWNIQPGLDSIVFKIIPRGYFTQDTYDTWELPPNIVFTGTLENDQILTGDVTWGLTTDREIIRERYGSCRASWNLSN